MMPTSLMAASLLSLMFAAQIGAGRSEATGGLRFVGVLLIVLLVLAIVYVAKRLMSK